MCFTDYVRPFTSIRYHQPPYILSRLQSVIGNGKASNWFSSYTNGRKQSIVIKGVESSLWELLFGVSQGSFLVHLLFVFNMSPLGRILRTLGIQFHCYTDNSQIFLTFNNDETESIVTKIEEAVAIIKKMMA